MTLEYDPGDLPLEFHARLAQLLQVMSGAILAGVKPGKQRGSWVVELAFPDRVERALITYAPDQIAV